MDDDDSDEEPTSEELSDHTTDEEERTWDDEINVPEEELIVPETLKQARRRHHEQRRSGLYPGRTDRRVQDLDNEDWEVHEVPGEVLPTHVTIVERCTSTTHVVPRARVRKAMQMLTYRSVQECLSPGKCTCKRRCYNNVERNYVVEVRKAVATAADESAAGDYITMQLRRDGSKLKVNGAPVCREFYAFLHGVGTNKIKKAMQVSKMGPGTKWAKHKSMKPVQKSAMKSVHAHSFWTIFFDDNCQRSGSADGPRLFPVNKTFDTLWIEYFLPWWKQQGRPSSEMPGRSTWEKARWHPDFKDVMRRAKHFHSRCATCQTLQALQQAAFLNPASMAYYQQQRRLHEEAIYGWRLLEEVYDARARQKPGEFILLSYDDTQAMGLPRMTNRDMKNFPNYRHEVVPWLITNHGLPEHIGPRREYVYTVKNRWGKGANRLLTELQAAVRRIKANPNNPPHKARHLCLIADNFVENKNAEILAWAADLVHARWFDKVEILFGEVGHTHNGNDATHNVHNNSLGNHISGDFGHFVWNFRHPWQNPKTRPGAHVLDVVYNWREHYKGDMVRISGHVKGQFDKYAVRAFLIHRDAEGVVELRWKCDPATEKAWRGHDGDFPSGGIHMRKTTKTSPPNAIPAAKNLVTPKVVNTLRSMASALAPWKLQGACKANGEAAFTGIIAVDKYLEGGEGNVETPEWEWGPLCTTGASELYKGTVRFIKKLWTPGTQNIWELPPATREAATSLEFHVSGDSDLINNRPLPDIRLHGVPREESAVYNHPNIVRARASIPLLPANPVNADAGQNADAGKNADAEQEEPAEEEEVDDEQQVSRQLYTAADIKIKEVIVLNSYVELTDEQEAALNKEKTDRPVLVELCYVEKVTRAGLKKNQGVTMWNLVPAKDKEPVGRWTWERNGAAAKMSFSQVGDQVLTKVAWESFDAKKGGVMGAAEWARITEAAAKDAHVDIAYVTY